MSTIKEKNTLRDDFVIEKFKAGFSPSEIQLLLKRQGFRSVSRIRIYQIVEEAGLRKAGGQKRT